jgi:hypothetical protein
MADDSLSRLLIKCASVLEMHGSHEFEEHLDSLISKKPAGSYPGKKSSSNTEESISFVVKVESRKLSSQINAIIELVAKELDITPNQLVSGVGEIPSFALAVTWTVIKKHLLISQKEIAKHFGRFTHTPISRKISYIKSLNPNNRVDKAGYDLFKKIDLKVSELINPPKSKK